ncbi:hypothetical protein CCR97_08150 [Rhodoplanes elegans]|uniref:GapR-like DNA-binding domain-containing protein n=1 Tax=Rhodoplanes elegans TaxID=29408 RepID=A0A327KV61_9BRAD|nr:GapR family DNA-binding domain-containing protein [Rhodoplanes elegans]MBK5958091.1 hypothetical protein [Rhodoplanes elegans]MBK5958183.1 hypothetical protein [Rhodoplanes elegans]RAI41966.1 hypothetical protein CH338_01290 [Rhodoplanes elegans]
MDKEMHALAERWANLEDQRKQIADDIKDLRAEAEGRGYDPKLLAKTVRIMRMEADKRAKELDQHQLFDVYLAGCGLIASAPVGRAVERAAKSTKPRRATPDHDSDGVIHEPASHDEAACTLDTEEGDKADDLDPAGRDWEPPPADNEVREATAAANELARLLREDGATGSLSFRDEDGTERDITPAVIAAVGRSAIDDGLDIPANLRRF